MEQQSFLGQGSRAPARRPLSFILAALAFAGAALLAPACGGNGDGGEGGSAGTDDCVGGVKVNGVCEGKCAPDKCLADNTCVGNRCVLKCDSHKDCIPDAWQSCTPAKEDGTGTELAVCQFTGKPAGMGSVCPFGNECGNWRRCDADGGTCFASQCGGNTAACQKDEEACKGIDNCTAGKCPAPDGSVCRTDCATACTPWLECQTTGEGDVDAYCTKRDCEKDDECSDGFYCGIVRDPHGVCGSSPPKGDNDLCGKTADDCIAVDPATGKATDGTSRFEGSLCMQRKTCLKRGADAPCNTDLDCSQFPSQLCTDFAGEKHCTPKCGKDGDCLDDHQCTNGACVPRFGAWKGAPETFCAPCLNDEDCGGKSSTYVCSTRVSNGMRACFDETFGDTCVTDVDCPKSESGLHGTCFNEKLGYGPGDSVYHHCYLPFIFEPDGSVKKVSCW